MDIDTTDGHVETGSTHLPKRQKITHDDSSPTLRHDEYTIAWICALHIEMAAARAVLDEIHERLPVPKNDSNTYILGSIKRHNIVIACLPIDRYGIVNAANVVTNMKQTFTAIRVGLMVGIGGGVPGCTDIRLGDIVVGTRVMQADLGKITEDGHLKQTGVPRFPGQVLATAVSELRAKHELEPSRVPYILQQKLECHGYGRPSLPDRLFHAMYYHKNPQESCDNCDISMTIPRRIRSSDDPIIHYGAIASGSQVVKSSAFRDKMAGELKVLCFEMEAAGLMDILPCLPIRGICDYSDSHKSKEWQKYAAATAAAYATELLHELHVTEAHPRDTCRLVPQQGPLQEQRQRMLDSLRFEQINARKTNISRAHAETCQWFLGHQDYKAWLDQKQLAQHHGFLWVSGKPGAGKSTIMKFAYSNMKRSRNKGVVIASFFFNARGEYLERSIIGMYRSLLLQLLEGYTDLQGVLEDPDLVPSPFQDTGLSLNALKDLLCDAVLALGQRSFTCFVDALDECDEQQVIDMIQYFEDLAEQSTARGVQFRVCFSSRHYPYLSIRWGLRFILEHQSGHMKDLEAYVENRLQTRDPMLIEKLQPEILRKAAGVFMWVVLVVDILNQEYRRGAMSMKKKLAELPGGLSDLFKNMLQRDKENIEEFKLCIIWILCAKRPLKPRELYHALWSGLSLQDPDESEIPDASDREIVEDDLPKFQRYVISSSKGLADIVDSTHCYQSVQFIHESVRDFLIKDKGLYELCPELGIDWESPSHEILKQTCSFYMTHRAVRDFIGMLPEGDKSSCPAIVLDKYPFLGYAREFVFYHANTAAKMVSQDEFLCSFQISNWIKINNLLENFEACEYSPDTSLYYILAERDSAELIRTQLKRDPNVHVVGGEYRYPLFAALANEEKDNFAALLKLSSRIQDGVDITDGINFTGSFEVYKGQTPMSWAVGNARADIVEILLQTENIVNGVDTRGRTPLLQASCEGHERIVRLFLDQGAEFDIYDYSGQTPLSWASFHGHETNLRILLARGAEVNTCDSSKRTPLLQASSNGYQTVSRILLDHGAEVNNYDKDGHTALSEASARGHENIVRLLIDRGAEINTCDRTRWTLLLEALYNGHQAVARTLLNRGARPQTGALFLTELGCALRQGCHEVAIMLIKRGAMVSPCFDLIPGGQVLLSFTAVARQLPENGFDLVDTGYEVYINAVHTALRLRCPEIAQWLLQREPSIIPDDFIIKADFSSSNICLANFVHSGSLLDIEFLLQRGVDPNAADEDSNKTALHWAAEKIQLRMVDVLLENGSNPNLLDSYGQTPLHYAAESGHEQVTRRLLDITDASITDSKGWTALRRARDRNHINIVRLLLFSWGSSDDCTDNQGKTLMDWMDIVSKLDGTDRLWGMACQ